MTKHILFYSNYCNHCQDLLTEIIKKGLRKQFVLICVEKHKDKLPGFVNRVPFIVNANGTHILEHNMSHFLDSISDKDEYDDITAFVSCPRGHFGNEFCYIDDPPQKNDVSSTLGYVFIDEDDKYQGCEQDTTDSRRKAMTENMNKEALNNSIINPKQMLQRDLFDSPTPSLNPEMQQPFPSPKPPPSYSPVIGTPSGPSKLPLNLQAQDPRLASLPSQYQQGGNSLTYNPNVDFGSLAPEKPLPFQQIKIEKPKKIGDNLVDDLVQQRMNDMKAFM